ncbi:MAG: SIMPL domain-containing protein [Hyphomicrobiales bacterium]|nr:SIMPL domain-containing protein [Hyphomicrobiales bacterium]
MIFRFAIAAVLCCLGSSAPARAQELRMPPHIRVTGTATANVKPDMAYLSLGVVTDRPTAADASAENAKATDAAIAALKAQGVEAKDIRTSNLSLTPLSDVSPTTGKTTQRGFRASNMVRVTFRDVGKAGAVAAKAIESGANVFYGLSFDISDRKARLDALRGPAVAEAKRLAGLYAAGAGVKLGKLLSLEPEGDQNNPRPMMYASRAKMAAEAAPVPVEPGEEEIATGVVGTWEVVE